LLFLALCGTSSAVLIILIGLLVALPFGALYLFITPATYTASATMMIESRKGPLDPLLGSAIPDPAWIDSQIGVLRSGNIASYVVKQLRLADDPEFIRSGVSPFRSLRNSMPLVSVIIPVHNRDRTLRRAIESALRQTIQDIEVIIVDDASADNTADVAQELVRSDTRVRLIQNTTNCGAQAARNVGARAAKGDWLNFFDSDDWMLPTSAEIRLNLARDRRVKIVHSDAFVLRPNQDPALFGLPPLSGSVYEEILRAPGPMFQSMIVAVDAFRQMGELDEDVVAYQEWDTAIRLARRHSFGFVPEATFIYDCTGNDTISKNLLQGAIGYEYIVNKHFSEMLLHVGPKAVSRHYATIAQYYTQAGASVLATKSKWKSFLWWPDPKRAVRTIKDALV
jgi:glycosyltransferase involved in cell wall biosynthesis